MPRTRSASGPDSLSALSAAIESIAVISACIPVQFGLDQTACSWDGGEGVGFPISDDLVEGLYAYRDLAFGRALPLLTPYADSGVAEIQLLAGSMYWLGQNGVDRRRDKAIHYLTLAAAQGSGQAFHYLSEIYRYPIEGAAVDPSLASECARRAVECGFEMAAQGWDG